MAVPPWQRLVDWALICAPLLLLAGEAGADCGRKLRPVARCPFHQLPFCADPAPHPVQQCGCGGSSLSLSCNVVYTYFYRLSMCTAVQAPASGYGATRSDVALCMCVCRSSGTPSSALCRTRPLSRLERSTRCSSGQQSSCRSRCTSRQPSSLTRCTAPPGPCTSRLRSSRRHCGFCHRCVPTVHSHFWPQHMAVHQRVYPVRWMCVSRLQACTGNVFVTLQSEVCSLPFAHEKLCVSTRRSLPLSR